MNLHRRHVLALSGAGVAGLLGAAASTPAQAATNNTEIAFDYFVNKGLTRVQAAGLVGNFIVESGADPINPAAVQGGGGPGRGIAQWEGSRRTELFNYANSRGLPWYNLRLQLDFVWKELTSTEARAMSKLKACTTVRSAAITVRVYYERPSVHADERRVSAAQSVYNRYAGNVEGPAPVVPTLVLGSTGSRVTLLQQTLNKWFPAYPQTPLAVDGQYGPRTESAVKEFQRRAGLTVDGKFGPITRSKFHAITGVLV